MSRLWMLHGGLRTGWWLAALIAVPALARQAERPNVVLIMTDDQGWGDVRSHGNPDLDTPVLDRLAREGARFERFYVSPVCAPTRAALLTGRYPLRTGVHGVTRAAETMRADETTLAEAFAAAGYRTGMVGKWHNGAHYPHDPNGQGFETFFGFSAGHWNNYFDTHLTYNGRRVETQGYITDVLTDSAAAFVDRHAAAGEPFLLYVAYNTPHTPDQVPDRFFDSYKQRGFDDYNAAIYGMVENVDENVGRLLAALDRRGVADDTIVLFLTDNGPNGDRYNGDMRGRKGHVDEGGVRVPLFVRWPAQIPAGRVVEARAAHIDLLPTLVDLAGLPMPDTKPLDGLSVAPLLRDEPSPDGSPFAERVLYTHWNVRGAVRSERWRAVDRGEGWTLYDMKSDPGQHADVAADVPDVLAELVDHYNRWHAAVTADGFDPIPAEVGHAERPAVELPGHEAYLRGDGISYVGQSGWANDWITNWTSPGAYAEWPIRVVAPGRYRATLFYTAAPAEVGAEFAVEGGGGRSEVTVAEAYDPPYVFSPDRTLRKEVYEKPWRPLDAGILELASGPTMLRLRLLERPGPKAPDVKAVRLERIR